MDRTYDGKALKVLRVMADLTQEQVADRAGISQASVSAIERGAEPGVKTLYLLSQVYGKSLDEMYELCWQKVA